MTTLEQNQAAPASVKPEYIWLAWGGALLLLLLVYRTSLEELFITWMNVEEYSHGFFIPVISFYLIWIRRAELVLTTRFQDSILGLSVMTIGLTMYLLGGLSAIRTLEQYSFLITLIGLFAAAFGRRGMRTAGVPLFFLIFMVPLPPFVMNNLSSKLQLISSWLGVEFIRSCDIMVFLEGNVIDLGSYRLQVVDACSGLRYLFPLSSLAFLCAFLFRGPFWQKLLVFLSSIPLTIFMNSFRIGVIGILVNHWGTEMAEGFLHDFEGWVVFLLCMVLLFIEMWILSRISGNMLAMNELVEIPAEWGEFVRIEPFTAGLNHSLYAVFLLLLAGTAASEAWSKTRADIIPQRTAFLNFPDQIGAWRGHKDYLAQYYLDELKLTDYALIDFAQPETHAKVNFYSAYYQTQRKGVGVHSPRSCIPGAGWQITLFEQKEFPDVLIDGVPLQVDRAIIEKGESKQLVYFWFQQRGRILTNEFAEKWFIFYDAMTLNRTDGALVRLVTDINTTQDLGAADQRLQAFARELLPILPKYLPGKNIVPAANPANAL
ncbi:MAG: VPLPA-CTERM-specific exosortase XrtD [Methylococcales bacterium]|nr:VPLPA-CTERM-specific exosortase XrtD [Methylococcales bacterium]